MHEENFHFFLAAEVQILPSSGIPGNNIMPLSFKTNSAMNFDNKRYATPALRNIPLMSTETATLVRLPKKHIEPSALVRVTNLAISQAQRTNVRSRRGDGGGGAEIWTRCLHHTNITQLGLRTGSWNKCHSLSEQRYSSGITKDLPRYFVQLKLFLIFKPLSLSSRLPKV